MSEKPYIWASGNHYCAPDARHLYNTQPELLSEHGFPVQLDGNPTPATFCSVCLEWFDDPAHLEGSDHRPPTQRDST